MRANQLTSLFGPTCELRGLAFALAFAYVPQCGSHKKRQENGKTR